jgi:hypothetical protein
MKSERPEDAIIARALEPSPVSKPTESVTRSPEVVATEVC